MAERLAVLLYDRVVGHLDRAGDEDPTFTYTSDYVAQGRVPLSLRLPISEETYSAKRVEPYLRGLLPENPDTLERWARELGTRSENLFDILALMGWDCPGAVQFCGADGVAEMRDRAAEYEPVDEAFLAERLRRLAAEPASWTMPGEHWSLGGQQEKFALTLLGGGWHQAGGAAATTHIFKPGIRTMSHQALVEHVTMRAAALLGIEVAESRILAFEDQWAIVVERYDRRVVRKTPPFDAATRTGGVLRIHQEDFCQALGRLPTQKYESRGGPRLRDMVAVVKRHLTNPEDDLLALADFLAINVVAGAPDGHSKNISLVMGPDGARRVAPLYDVATGLAYDSAHVERTVAVSVGGERSFSRIRARQWAKAAEVLGIPPSLMLARVSMLASQFPDAFESALHEAGDADGVDEVAGRTLPAVREHCQRILDQLGPEGLGEVEAG